MTVQLLACVTPYNNKLAIGADNDLLFTLKEDMRFLKSITSTRVSAKKNVVVMGRRTWFSIPAHRRPLENRLNIVLTNDPALLRVTPFPKGKLCWEHMKKEYTFDKDMYYMTFVQFQKLYAIEQPNVFVLGGSSVYSLFLNSCDLQPSTVHLTQVYGTVKYADRFIEPLSDEYKLVGVSEKFVSEQVSYRILTYKLFPGYTSDEHKYMDLCKHILLHGKIRPDRTGVGTISTFGYQMRFDISNCIPLLTTKQVPWRSVIHELLWFMKGNTDAKLLRQVGVNIWNGNTSRSFLDQRGLEHYDEGILGPSYGWLWRFFGAKYSQAFADTTSIDNSKIGGFDQLQYIIDELKSDPYSRRALMCYWNPSDMHKMAIPACHFSCQFYVEDDLSNTRRLHCHFTMRSTDVFLGLPFNIVSYSVLTYIIALKCGFKPGSVVYTGGDVHLYRSHLEQVYQQVGRQAHPFPKLLVDPSVQHKDFEDITVDDFEVVGYFPEAPIKARMAV